MKAILEEGKNIYLQIAELIEDDILSGAVGEDELVPSTNQIARHFSINPATAAKGINLLVDEGILYKKRGIGMCVSAGGREKVLAKRKREFSGKYIKALLREAEKLGLSREALAEMILSCGEESK